MSAIFDTYFGNQIKAMYAGIEATMKKETSYSCALLLSVYTEIMGGLVTGNLRKEGEKRRNYDAFLEYLGQPYVDLKENLYSKVRSALVHEFAPSCSYVIWLNDPAVNRPGIDYSHSDRLPLTYPHEKDATYYPMEHVNFHLREYYRDFKNGVAKYREQLKDEKNPLFINFITSLAIRD